MAPAAPPFPPAPLAPLIAAGRDVLVPAALWPDHACTEHEGRGWSARVLQLKRGAAQLRFAHLLLPNGRRDKGTYWLDVTALEPR